MRTLTLLALLGLSACDKRSPPGVTVEAPPTLRSAIEFGDPRAAFQIERGLHEIEAGAWRWSSGRFVVRLAAPPDAARKGARLRLTITIPDPVISQLGDATLSCSVNNVPMPPETWATAGQVVLEREVAPIVGPVATLECATAKVIPPSAQDQRELGVIVRSVRLEPR